LEFVYVFRILQNNTLSLTMPVTISKIREIGKTIMAKSPIPRQTIALVMAGAIILPIAICLIMGAASLLAAMGDTIGGGVMRWIAFGCGIVWALDLILLVLVLSIKSLSESDDTNADEE
jgi:hypothetical protein